jgi:hypothetical protein
MQASTVVEIERNVIYVDSLSTSKNMLTELCNSPGHQDSEITSTFSSCSIVQQSSLNVEEPPMHIKTEKEDKAKINSPYKCTVSGLEHNEVRKITASSSESLPQFPAEIIVYLDDIEEFQSFTKNDGDCQDQRLFKFKSSVLPKSEKIGISCDQGNVDHYESWSEKSGSRSSRKSGKASGKRFRRRSMSRENESLNDIECVTYYGKPSKSSPIHQPRKHQKKRLKKPCCLDSSLGHPFYFCTSDDKHNQEVLPWKRKRGITTLVSFPTPGPEQQLLSHESDKEMEWTTIPQKQNRRSYDSDATVYNVFTYPNYQPNEQNKEMEGKSDKSDSPGSCVSSNVSCEMVASSFTRAETMPPERSKEDLKETMPRSNSCPFQYPKHVHPKLPEYDDIAAKFMALKKQHLQNKTNLLEHKAV